MNYSQTITDLFNLSTPKAITYTSKVIPNCNTIIGVNMSTLRKYFKENVIFLEIFLTYKANEYYEVDLLKALAVINKKESIEDKINSINKYSYTITNWATTDIFLNVFKERNEIIFSYAIDLLKSHQQFRIRLGIILLMNYIDEDYLNKIFEAFNKIKDDFYYTEMAMAWFLSISYSTLTHLTMQYLNDNKLSNFVIRKTVSKIQDSLKISKELKLKAKDYLNR